MLLIQDYPIKHIFIFVLNKMNGEQYFQAYFSLDDSINYAWKWRLPIG